MASKEKYKDASVMNLQYVKDEPPDVKEEYDMEPTNYSLSDVTLENDSDDDELYDSDLESYQFDENCEHNLPFTCEICKKGFRTYRSLQVHSTIHIRNEFMNMSTCTICNKKFEARKLTYHFRSHNVRKPFQCLFCDLTYFTQSHLDEHIVRCHTGYTCNKCHISFEKETELKDHYKSHVEDYLYACSICDQTFSTTANLSRHISTHKKKRKLNSYS